MSDEIRQIQERYAKRRGRYDPWTPWVYLTRQGIERSVVATLERAGMFPPGNRSVLDLGCGMGNMLLFFLQLGFSAERLYGIDLIGDRVALARRRLPAAVRLETAEASQFNGPDATFDVVFQSMVFSSVLDRDLRFSIAANMWRMTRPGGGVLWYDFTWNNPSNPDVKGVSVAEIRELFPEGRPTFSRVTLAPPLARMVAGISPALYGFLSLAPILRTHVVAWIGKPTGAV
jgi:ubiquinone/menaquinone biosynthesis C-methylase UbiE